VKQPQWITLGVAAILTIGIFVFARTVPHKKIVAVTTHSENDGHNHGADDAAVTIDTILNIAKKQISPEQGLRLTMLENSISRGDVKEQQVKVYHQLAHFWGDSMGFFPPYAWYEAEAARLENSEKSLTFAAHLFLSNVQTDRTADPALTKWKALQAKDLFERSLKINPDNDSSRVGLGACYLFGNISANPMEGIKMITEVTTRDSTNVYAQTVLAQGSLISGQFEKAISRLHTVYRIQPDNIEAILMLADVYEQTGDKKTAITWYRKSLEYVKRPDARAAIETRITDLEK
jgi:tetratricopeptide (TPR) repeat protein